MISTHVLDTSRGQPAVGVSVILERLAVEGSASTREMTRAKTDADGRVRELLPNGATNLKTIRFRQQQVAYNYLRPVPESEFHSGIAIGGLKDFPICPREQLGDGPTTILIILND